MKNTSTHHPDRGSAAGDVHDPQDSIALAAILLSSYARLNDDKKWDSVGECIMNAANEFDLEKLRVYQVLLDQGMRAGALPFVDSFMVFLRRIGYTEIASFITMEHIDAVLLIESEISKNADTLNRYTPLAPRYDSLQLFMLTNFQRREEITSIVRTRKVFDVEVVKSIIADIDAHHPAVSGGTL